MSLAVLFFISYLLDIVLGDPRKWPHPVKWMGNLCDFWEKNLYYPSLLSGVFFWLAVFGSLMTVTIFLMGIITSLPYVLGALIAIYFMYATLATRSLHQESQPVETALLEGDLLKARQELSWIVSRETSTLPPAEIRRGAIETVAENLSDGVVAPIFYGLTLGLPGMLVYKLINTMDSMVGYKNDRYLLFGRTAAKIDDLANYLPARITGFLIVASSTILGLDYKNAWRILLRDRRNAASPNAGWPEAALAGALSIQLGGPSLYFGQRVEKPYIGDFNHDLGPKDYRGAVKILYGVSALAATGAVAILAAAKSGLWGLVGMVF